MTTFDEARDRVEARLHALIPDLGAENAVHASEVPLLFAGTDLHGPAVVSWVQDLSTAVCESIGLAVEDGSVVAGEMLRTFLVGFEMGRASAQTGEGS